VHHVGGLVLLAADGLRREIGRVGLGEDPIRGDPARRGAELRRLGEGDVAGERDIPAALERRRQQARRAEAVEDDGAGEAAQGGERVLVRGARVDDDRLAELAG
jgi:hypothetical protein